MTQSLLQSRMICVVHCLAEMQIKAGLAAARVNSRLYGWSSFRRGGATTCFLATKDVESLRAHGDWASSAYTRYQAIPAPDCGHLVTTLQNTLV